jgi:hypothetical protein
MTTTHSDAILLLLLLLIIVDANVLAGQVVPKGGL